MPTPPVTGCQPAEVRCHTSSVASDPPVPVTESTWVAPPTEPENQGLYAAFAAGVRTREIADAHSAASSRRMALIVAAEHHRPNHGGDTIRSRSPRFAFRSPRLRWRDGPTALPTTPPRNP